MSLSPTLSGIPGPRGLPDKARQDSQAVRTRLIQAGVYHSSSWRVSPSPFLITGAEMKTLEALGRHLLAFLEALNRLYYESIRGAQPGWVADYLDQGKPRELVEFARMNQWRSELPGVIRPDLILTENGWIISELDSVPGGIGITGCMAQAYGDLGWSIIGGRNGMIDGFSGMIRRLAGNRPPSVAIVVSEESKDYRPEMAWLAAQLRETGLPAETVSPNEVALTEEGLRLAAGTPITVLYRFFELFDLKNIPNVELMFDSAKNNLLALTPPVKPWLEEKMAFALLHHPGLSPFWTEELGDETFEMLRQAMPPTWILDPQPLPTTAIIPGLAPRGKTVSDWQDLARLGQKERRFVVKPSGFSELAWGSRGVSVGHDMSRDQWANTLQKALASYPTNPYILQEFKKGRRVASQYQDPVTEEIREMPGRVRLSPYYFRTGDSVDLAGILATVCPLDKKLIHGMTEAVMMPCALDQENPAAMQGKSSSL
jgi:hypothetical protein